MAAYDRSKGRVHEVCKCYYNENKKVKLDSSCYLSGMTLDDCTWYDKCLRVQLEDVLKCDKSVITFIVKNAQQLCQANNELLNKVPNDKRDGLMEIHKCLQLPLKPLLFRTDSKSCTELEEKFRNNAKHCFTTFTKEWICNISEDWWGITRYLAYKTMKSELMAVLNLETYDDIYANKWFWHFWELHCDIKLKDPVVKRILISTSLAYQEDVAEVFTHQLAKTAKWKDRCVDYESVLFHTLNRRNILFIEISIFPYHKYDFFTQSCAQEPNMEQELGTLMRIANGISKVSLVIKCKDGEKECIEADFKEALESDTKCLSLGGYCEADGESCSGIYAETVMCSNKKKCCIKQGNDTVCPAIGGKCIEDFERCLTGSIVSAKCGTKRHCCVSYYIVSEQDTVTCSDVKIISRESWGARKSVTEHSLRTDIEMPYYILHHTAGKSCSGLEKCSKFLTDYQYMHMLERHWLKFLIDDDGNVYEGVGWKLRGIHSHDFNARSYAASFFGTFTYNEPTQKAINASFRIAECGISHNLLADDFNYLGHRDVRPTKKGNKDCPGFKFYKRMNTWEQYSHIAVLSYSSEDDQECLDKNGQCLDTDVFQHCVNGTFHEKSKTKCTGHSNRKCCVPTN